MLMAPIPITLAGWPFLGNAATFWNVLAEGPEERFQEKVRL